MDNVYRGRCHCGAIRYEYTTASVPGEWSVRSCQCSFCRAHGSICTSDPDGQIRFVFDEPGQLSRYRFGLRTADFLLCRRCGVYIGAMIERSGRKFGIICTNALDSRPEQLPAARPMTYDAEATGDRVQRRIERWTPVIDG